MKRFEHFVRPPEEVYRNSERDFLDGYHTYGEYNYLRPGIVSRIKTAHFEKALAFTQQHFGRCNVIDFGCADGVFLPSLAKHFVQVAAVDRVPMFTEIAGHVVREIGANNVEVICNEKMSEADLESQLAGKPYRIAFCLEVIEHVGEPGDLYGPKLRLLEQLADLLEPGGSIVMSVPTMVGVPFLIQRMALATLGIWREPMSTRSLLKAAFLKDTSDLEPGWDGGHLGFNHLRLEEALRGRFRIEKRSNLGFQMIYLIQRARG